jgi:crotonobetainyl-CoA:carnitine CoA-transferase CaiB-like acyl-CoA transferase
VERHGGGIRRGSRSLAIPTDYRKHQRGLRSRSTRQVNRRPAIGHAPGHTHSALKALLPPVRMEAVEPVMGAIPELGQHTDAVLEELGYDRATIEAWRRDGVV